MHITQGFVLVGAIVLETAIAMVLLSRVLPYQANRWANIIAAVIQTAGVAFSLTGPLYWNLFYVFFSTIEMACTVFIVWFAWTWPHPEGAALTRMRKRVNCQVMVRWCAWRSGGRRRRAQEPGEQAFDAT